MLESVNLPGVVSAHDPKRNVAFEILRLQKARKEATGMIRAFQLPGTMAGKAFSRSDPIALLRSYRIPLDRSYEDTFHYIHLVEDCWISLAVARTSTTESLDIRSYLSEWTKDLPPQIFLSKHVPSFSSATHFFFTGEQNDYSN